MSSRPFKVPYAIITNGDMSTTITSKATIIQMISMISYQVNFTGASPVGEVKVQVSNDYSENVDGSVKNAGNWTNLTLSTASTVSGNSGTNFIDIDQCAAYAIRIQYTPVSGTGTMNGFVGMKVA